jgi:alpha-glucosidase
VQALSSLPSSEALRDLRIEGADWWRRAVGYEIYVRSFADANGDGVGDLPGITDRLPYLASLGVDVIWITPFMPSPGFDHGYDVSDYCDVDPRHGSLTDFDALVSSAHTLGLRVFVDIVPNHTSSHHRWFRAAVDDPTGPYRDYYVWSDPAPNGGPPNNWVSHFGGPAWTLDPGGSGQYFCHLFLPEQPDLNWANPAVMEEFTSILRFWCERGADGFRIDVAHALTKDPALRDNPQRRPVVTGMDPQAAFMSFDHVHDLNRAETAQLFHEWRDAVAPYGAVLMGEMFTPNVDRFATFVADQRGLHAGFVLGIGLSGWKPAGILDMLVEHQAKANGGCAWEVSNHDQARAVSRYGGGDDEAGLRRTLALTTLMMAFDGMVFLYEGEELGLPDAVITGAIEDPMSNRNGAGVWTRDVSRGPIPWGPGHTNGFTSADEAWLRTEPLPVGLTVEGQLADQSSTWWHYRRLVMLRKEHPEMTTQPFELVERGDDYIVVRRGPVVVAANFGSEAVHIAGFADTSTVFISDRGVTAPIGTTMPPECTVVARSDR